MKATKARTNASIRGSWNYRNNFVFPGLGLQRLLLQLHIFPVTEQRQALTQRRC